MRPGKSSELKSRQEQQERLRCSLIMRSSQARHPVGNRKVKKGTQKSKSHSRGTGKVQAKSSCQKQAEVGTQVGKNTGSGTKGTWLDSRGNTERGWQQIGRCAKVSKTQGNNQSPKTGMGRE